MENAVSEYQSKNLCKVNRDELLRRLLNLGAQKPPEDELDQVAVPGYQYLDDPTQAPKALERLDQIFEQRLGSSAMSRQRSISTYRWIGIAATLALTLASLIWWWLPPRSERLFHAYFQWPQAPKIEVERSASPGAMTDWEQVLMAYATQQYALGIDLIDRIKDHAETPASWMFYKGICLLGLGQSEAAADMLSMCQGDSTCSQQHQPAWYLALALIRVGQSELSIPWLLQTADEGGAHAPQANSLLRKLGVR